MIVLVTGAAGRAGQRLVQELAAAGHSVLAMYHTRPPPTGPGGFGTGGSIEWFEADITAPSTIERAFEPHDRNVDAVVHAAAIVGSDGFADRDWCYRTNVTGTQNLLAAATRAGVERFIHISSTCVVSEYLPHHATNESIPYAQRWHDPYTPSKIDAERVLCEWAGDGTATAPSIVILRPGWLWGPAQRGMLQLLALAHRSRVWLPGGGRAHVHFTHIANLAHAVMLALAFDPEPILDAGTVPIMTITDDTRCTVGGFLEQLAAALGRPPPRVRTLPTRVAMAAAWCAERVGVLTHRTPRLTRLEVSNIVHEHTYDLTAARERLGYRPPIATDAGLAELAAWYRDREEG